MLGVAAVAVVVLLLAATVAVAADGTCLFVGLNLSCVIVGCCSWKISGTGGEPHLAHSQTAARAQCFLVLLTATAGYSLVPLCNSVWPQLRSFALLLHCTSEGIATSPHRYIATSLHRYMSCVSKQRVLVPCHHCVILFATNCRVLSSSVRLLCRVMTSCCHSTYKEMKREQRLIGEPRGII
jgi:hypothetical protein